MLPQSSGRSYFRGEGGQVIIEYVLLLVVAVTIAAILVRGLASRAPDNEGIVVKKWMAIQSEIGADLPDKCVGNSCAH